MSSYQPIKRVQVSLCFGKDQPKRIVGQLARREQQVYFEYDSDFIKTKLEISPLQLPLQTGLVLSPRGPFEGLFGVFNDSLPDGWGRLLYDRKLRSLGLLPEQVTVLDRLCAVGDTGFGALCYEPVLDIQRDQIKPLVISQVADEVETVQKNESYLESLYLLNGSSAGARPKIVVGYHPETQEIFPYSMQSHQNSWIIKFPNSFDGKDAGRVEYIYSLMAQEAGLEMTETQLFENKYFGTKRFDVVEGNRSHLHSVCGLLHSDFRVPCLDYLDIIKLTYSLTQDIQQVKQVFKQAVFNVMSHNRDDHSKNFSFLMNPQGDWRVSPAYDITFSYGPGGEHSMLVMGEGKKPTLDHLRKLGQKAQLNKSDIEDTIERVRSAIQKWPLHVEKLGVLESVVEKVRAGLVLQ